MYNVVFYIGIVLGVVTFVTFVTYPIKAASQAV